jgi:hypothetical protein
MQLQGVLSSPVKHIEEFWGLAEYCGDMSPSLELERREPSLEVGTNLQNLLIPSI